MASSGEIRKKLKAGKPSIGTWLQIPNPDVAEIIGRMGYDWAAVDMEHGSFTRAMLPDIFRALERWGTQPFARLVEATKSEIKAALDSGARGLIFPMIESRAQLDEAIAHALYPGGSEFPGGARGVGFSRANLFGLDFDAHLHPQTGHSREIVLVAQIEHVRAVPELDAIFSHPRLDAYMVGPYDLSASMDLTGRFDEPEYIKVLETIQAKAKAHGMPRGYHVVAPEPETLAARIKDGYTFLAYGIDALFLMGAARCPKR